MADEQTPTITLTMTPQGPLDEGYAQVQKDANFQEMLQMESAAIPAAPEQPSALATGAAAAFQAAGQGAQNTMQGLSKFLLPTTGVSNVEEAGTFLKGKVEAVRQALIEGLGGLALSPLVGVGAGARQALENQNPELANAVALEPLQASFVRMMMGGGNPLKEGQQADINQPMTVGEALDLVVQSGGMVAAGAAGKVGKAIKEQAPVLKGERGSMIIEPTPFKEGIEKGGSFTSNGTSLFFERKGDSLVVHSLSRASGAASLADLNTVVDSLIAHAEQSGATKIVADFANPQIKALLEKLGVPLTKVSGGTQKFSFNVADFNASRASGGGGLVPPEGPPPAPPGGPTPERPPGGESRLNVERIEATDRVKSLMTEINKLVGEKILAKHREVVTHEATIESAKKYSLQDALAADPNTVPLAEGRSLQQAIRDYHVAIGTKMSVMEAERAKTLGSKLPDEYVDLFAMQVALAKNNELFQAAHARGLEALNIMSDAGRARLVRDAPKETLQISNALRMNATDPATLADRLAAMRAELDLPQQRSWQHQIYQGARAGKDLLYAAWVQSLLSGWRTHAKNVVGTAGVFAFEAPEHFAAELIGLMRNDPKGRMAFGETALALRGAITSMRDGVRLATEAWQANQAPFEAEARQRSTVDVRIAQQGVALTEGKVGRTAMGAEAYGFDPESKPGKVIDVLAKALNSRFTPGAALIVEDAFGKGIAYHMSMDALALREAYRQGGTSVDIEARYKQLKAQPTKDMIIEAQDQAILLTLNKELGPRGQAFVTLLDSVPGARVIVPFVRWSTNAAKWFGQRAPIIAQLSEQNRNDMAEGGVLRDKAIARQVLGTAVASGIAYEVLQGNITGGSNNKQERALKPFKEGPDYAIRLPDGRYLEGYNQWLGAPGQMIAAVADYVDILRLIPNQEYFNEWAAKLEGLILATGNIFVQQSAMQGVGNVYDAIQDPQRSAGKEFRSLARSLVPTMLRDITRASDDNLIREARGLGDAVRAGLPWTVDGLAPFRHPVTGEPRVYPPGVASEMTWPFGFFANMSAPLGFTAKRDDVWAKEIIANRITLPEVGWWINGSDPHPDTPHMTEVLPSAGVEISPWERDFWITQMTQVQKDGSGRTLPEALTYAMRPGSRYWNQSEGPEGGRSIEIKAIYNAFKQKAYAALLDPQVGSPTLKARVLAQLETRMKAKLPVTDPRSQAAVPGR